MSRLLRFEFACKVNHTKRFRAIKFAATQIFLSKSFCHVRKISYLCVIAWIKIYSKDNQQYNNTIATYRHSYNAL